MVDGIGALLFDHTHEERTSCPLHGFDFNTVGRCHGRIRKFQRVEIEHSVDDLVGNGGPGTDQSTQAVEGRGDKQGIAKRCQCSLHEDTYSGRT